MFIIDIIINSSRATRRWPDCSGELAPMTQGSARALALMFIVLLLSIVVGPPGGGPTALMSWRQQGQGSAGAHRLGAGTRR